MSQDPVREQIAEILATNAQQFLVVINGRDKFDTDRAATIVLEHLGYGTARCPRCGLYQAPADDEICPPCDHDVARETITELGTELGTTQQHTRAAVAWELRATADAMKQTGYTAGAAALGYFANRIDLDLEQKTNPDGWRHLTQEQQP